MGKKACKGQCKQIQDFCDVLNFRYKLSVRLERLKKEKVKRFYWSILLLLPSCALLAQKIELKGTIKDQSGERLPQAYIVVLPDSITVPSNTTGSFTMNVLPGKKVVRVSYIGFENLQLNFNVSRDSTIQVVMRSKVNSLQEVVVTGQRNLQEEIFESNRTSTHILTKDIINAIPVLGGEADVIKTLQLLPGTVRGVEGSSDLFVRGGAADQNLVLLDGAPIYNTKSPVWFSIRIQSGYSRSRGGHQRWFSCRVWWKTFSPFSMFKSTSDIATRTHVSGDIGIIASRLYVEQPLVKNKASFWIAGRRTYIDQVIKNLSQRRTSVLLL